MNWTLFLTVFSILALIYFTVAVYFSKNPHGEDDYFLAKRSLGWFSIAFTLIATQVGAGMILGTTEEAYHVGFYGILYNLGMGIGLFLLAFGVASRFRALQIKTTAELFESQYGSIWLRRFASILSILTLMGILGGQIIASYKLLHSFSTAFDGWMILFWLSLIAYTMIGGLRGVVATDILQVIIIVVVLSGIALALIAQPGFEFAALQQYALSMSESASASRLNLERLFGFLWMPALFSLIEQDLAQRFFAAQNKRTAMFGALVAALFLMLFACIPVFFGIQARMLGIEVPAGQSPLILLVQTLQSDWAMTLILCALVAAIGSTANSLLCAIGSNVVYDFKLSTIEKHGLWISRLVTASVGLLAMAFAYWFDDILYLMIQSYELSVSCLLVPTIASLFMKNLSKESAIASVAAGLLGFVAFRLFPVSIPKELCTLALSGLAFGITAYFKTVKLD